jgi:hypothetical protein
MTAGPHDGAEQLRRLATWRWRAARRSSHRAQISVIHEIASLIGAGVGRQARLAAGAAGVDEHGVGEQGEPLGHRLARMASGPAPR